MEINDKNMRHDIFYALLGQMPGADKEQLVWEYSAMRTTSLKEFAAVDPSGYERMIEDMRNNVAGNREKKLDEMKYYRSAILHRLQKHGVDTTSWREVNRFLEQPRVAGKRLYEMSVQEMQSFLRKIEAILKKDAEAARLRRGLEQCN